jgi:hypothetical protein
MGKVYIRRRQAGFLYDLNVRLLRGFSGFATTIGTLLLRFVMGMGLFVVVAAFAAEEEENLLRVSSAHTGSLPLWIVAVKRTTMYYRG